MGYLQTHQETQDVPKCHDPLFGAVFKLRIDDERQYGKREQPGGHYVDQARRGPPWGRHTALFDARRLTMAKQPTAFLLVQPHGELLTIATHSEIACRVPQRTNDQVPTAFQVAQYINPAAFQSQISHGVAAKLGVPHSVVMRATSHGVAAICSPRRR